MTDVHGRAGTRGRAPAIAIGFAVVALLTSVTAVIVVASRDKPAPAPAATVSIVPLEHAVTATDVAKLKRDVVEKAVDASGATIGVKVKEDTLRTALGLGAEDVITAISGRTIKREFDVYDAVLGLSMMDTSTVYVDLLRDKKPVLVRWKVDGSLRAARRDPPRGTAGSIGTLGSLGSGGGLGSLGGSPFGTSDPFAARDPLLDTIIKIDDLNYRVPRATVDRLLANPDAFARQARIVPAIRNGQPEGFKLYAIRPNTLWASIGLKNGDTIRAINGMPLTSLDKALEVYTKVKDATQLEIELSRRGNVDEVLTITVK
ncbi:MAG: hypothetical protein H0T89_06220 [Deltaproteobacteria bacterium]|nr:hypothetical protein [Deltaproteobacteria bacterium]MDQ3296657.1 hypothetical protein [Myxococcota bacterium]